MCIRDRTMLSARAGEPEPSTQAAIASVAITVGDSRQTELGNWARVNIACGSSENMAEASRGEIIDTVQNRGGNARRARGRLALRARRACAAFLAVAMAALAAG